MGGARRDVRAERRAMSLGGRRVARARHRRSACTTSLAKRWQLHEPRSKHVPRRGVVPERCARGAPAVQLARRRQRERIVDARRDAHRPPIGRAAKEAQPARHGERGRLAIGIGDAEPAADAEAAREDGAARIDAQGVVLRAERPTGAASVSGLATGVDAAVGGEGGASSWGKLVRTLPAATATMRSPVSTRPARAVRDWEPLTARPSPAQPTSPQL